MEDNLKKQFEEILEDNNAGYESILIPCAIDAMFEAYTLGKQEKEAKAIEIYKWLLGYYDFPEPPTEGRPKYYWRSHLREKLKEADIEIEPPTSPFQPRETTH